MFDARYFAFMSVAALLVLSPGATMAVVLQTAVEWGRKASFATVVGVAIGNSTVAGASALGLAALFARWPWALGVVKIGGAIYLGYLGCRGLWHVTHWAATASPVGPRSDTHEANDPVAPTGRAGAALRRGVITNLLNPSVIVFYVTMVPQFIGPADPFLMRFLVLGATHVSMAFCWLTLYAVLMGTLAERMTKPGVRRVMEMVTGVVLVGFAVRLFMR